MRAGAATAGRRTPAVPRALSFGRCAISLCGDDSAAEEWLVESLTPWFEAAAPPVDVEVSLSTAADAYRALAARRPAEAAARACFALDQQVVRLPGWRENAAIALEDAERSCFVLIEPSRVRLVADRATLRWRFTLQWLFHEIAATRARERALDLHAAAVEVGGRAIALVGPKGSGKTTLALRLLRSGLCRLVANDRAFAEPAADGFSLRGVPTPVKLPPAMLERFPELARGLRPLERPYLRALRELVGAGAADLPGEDFALGTAQVAHQLGVGALAAAPLGAIVFPEIDPDGTGFAVDPLAPREVEARLPRALYGAVSGRAEPTVFEEMLGARGAVSGARGSAPEALGARGAGTEALGARIASAVPAVRARVGRGADARADLVEIARP